MIIHGAWGMKHGVIWNGIVWRWPIHGHLLALRGIVCRFDIMRNGNNICGGMVKFYSARASWVRGWWSQLLNATGASKFHLFLRVSMELGWNPKRGVCCVQRCVKFCLWSPCCEESSCVECLWEVEAAIGGLTRVGGGKELLWKFWESWMMRLFVLQETTYKT